MRVNWNYIKIIALLVVVTGLYAFSNKRSGAKNIAGVNVEFVGDQSLYVTEAMVNKLLIQNYGNLTKRTQRKISFE